MRNHQGAAKIGAELVAVQTRRRYARVRNRVVGLGQVVVAVELPKRAVQIVGSRLDDDVHVSACGGA